tara:strand:+ start:1172 stop:2539 length:1368 start_codon:yes stop_codon:yes gene_type:complete
MGLCGGATGAKAQFIEKFGAAFQSAKTLGAVRGLVGVDRSSTLAVLDGNVMLNAIPSSVDSFDGYVAVISHQISDACFAAAHVVVVFDEPDAITTAKRDEQRRRDAARKPKTPVCSDDLTPGITTDEFTQEMLNADGFSGKVLMEHRRARPRFFDAVCVALMERFVQRMTTGAWSLTFDGIDSRGAGREFGQARIAGIYSNHQDFWEGILSRNVPIGEGDLKLTDVTKRVHDSSLQPGSPVAGVVLNLVVTIDTDSFVIELLQEQTRKGRDDEFGELTILCLRERARKRKGDDFITDAHFLCCDQAVFHHQIELYFYGTTSLSEKTRLQQPSAMALLAIGLACCGCDFLEVKGMRADLVLPVVRDIVKNHSDKLDLVKQIFHKREVDVLKATPVVQFLIQEYAKSLEGVPRMQRAQASASNACDMQVLRALWTCCYWHQNEFKNCASWGFVATSG